MPELPEVETARSLIADEALNRLIVDADDHDAFVCRPHSPGELREALVGRRSPRPPARQDDVAGDLGRGRLADTRPDLGIHLGMRPDRGHVQGRRGGRGGGPRRRDAQPRKAEWDRFTLTFADGGSLVLFDKRRLGRVRLNPHIEVLGPDVAVVTRRIPSLITKGSIAVKERLLDQSKIAGVGNLLANESSGRPRYPRRRAPTACNARTRTACTAP